jgi:hypothetical protein
MRSSHTGGSFGKGIIGKPRKSVPFAAALGGSLAEREELKSNIL